MPQHLVLCAFLGGRETFRLSGGEGEHFSTLEQHDFHILFLVGWFAKSIWKLQQVQNATARLLKTAFGGSRTEPGFSELPWLAAGFRGQFRAKIDMILRMVFGAEVHYFSASRMQGGKGGGK